MRDSHSDPAVDVITGDMVDAALAVHTAMGPGLLERVYQVCLAHELESRGHQVEVEVLAPVVFNGIRLDAGYRLDLLVDGKVIVEVKAVQALDEVHVAQLLTYLRMTACPVGLLINFNEAHLRRGIRRVTPRRKV